MTSATATVIPRHLLDSRHVLRVARDHDPAGIFAKQRELGRKPTRREIHARADGLGERFLRERDRQAAVRAIVRRIDQALLNQFDDRLLQGSFLLQSSSGGYPHSVPRISFAF